MLEINRLKPMIDNYDPKLFEELYEKTRHLRRKLSLQIDHRRFGVDNEEIQSWFTVKFIYVFNKYHNTKRDLLLGYLINALKLFKYRIMKAAYTVKFKQNIVEFSGNEHDSSYKDDPFDEVGKDYYFDELCKYLKTKICDNAYMLLQVQLNPPPYILHLMQERGIDNIHKIPDDVLRDYFDLGLDPKSINYLESLKDEIKAGIILAKGHFARN